MLPDPGEAIHIVIEANRKVASRPGVEVHRRTNLHPHVAWNMCPPRLRIHDAVLDIAASARCETQAIAVLTDSVNSRITAVSIGSQRVARPLHSLLELSTWVTL